MSLQLRRIGAVLLVPVVLPPRPLHCEPAVSDAEDLCRPSPCLNGGECTVEQDERRCVCVEGFTGDRCQINADDCTEDSCANGGKCIDQLLDFTCECPFGFHGKQCEQAYFWTLQQWRTGTTCSKVPWRCMRLQLNRCVDTGLREGLSADSGSVPEGYDDDTKTWYGRLQLSQDGLYSLSLCWGAPEGADGKDGSASSLAAANGSASASAEEEEDARWRVPDQWCDCENSYPDIPRFGERGIGPKDGMTPEGTPDSAECHRLLGVTGSRLTNSTGVHFSKAWQGQDKEHTNIDCRSAAHPRVAPLALAAHAIFLFVVGFAASPAGAASANERLR